MPIPTLVMKNVIECCCVVLYGAGCCADVRYEPKSVVAAKIETTSGVLVIRATSDYFWKAERPIHTNQSSHQLRNSSDHSHVPMRENTVSLRFEQKILHTEKIVKDISLDI